MEFSVTVTCVRLAHLEVTALITGLTTGSAAFVMVVFAGSAFTAPSSVFTHTYRSMALSVRLSSLIVAVPLASTCPPSVLFSIDGAAAPFLTYA